MKLFSPLLIFALMLFFEVSTLNAQVVNIPDANFKAYLIANIAINTNEDTEIQLTEATAFTGTINCPNLSIADLTGVEAFVNLTQLKCFNNQLSSLNVTQNTHLVVLHCVNNSISSLDVSQNTSLSWLYCSGNQLVSLDLSQNTSLTKLYCGSNQLSSLNIMNGNNTILAAFNTTNNANLSCIEVDNPTYSTTNWTNIDGTTSFNTNCTVIAPIVTIPDANFKTYLVGNTAINTNGDTEIQVTEAATFSGTINCSSLNIADLTGIEAFENVTDLDCSSNNLTTLELTQNTSLTTLDCHTNNLTTLDLTQNTNLAALICHSNALSSLEVKNGNNSNFTSFNATNNTSLTCIEVDDVVYSTNNWTNVDAGTSFSTNCSGAAPIVSIPDANFKAYLVGNTTINTNGDTDIQVTEALAFGGTINCPNLNIADLTGIEAFVNLRQLKCFNNNLTSLDVTQNTRLVVLHCVNNSISSLDVRQNTSLSWLYCSNNTINSLDLSQNVHLTKLYCTGTMLSSLEVTQNTSLLVLDCSSAQLISLNVKNGVNTNLTTFKATNNPNLTCIAVDDPAYSNANWTQIDATASFNSNCFTAASIVDVPDTNFKAYLLGNTAINTNGDLEIQVTEATAFTGTMNCSNRAIADLTGIEAFVNLNQLRCYRNDLTKLDLSQNTSLTQLHCYNNKLNTINVTQNPSLIVLHCVNNLLSNIDVTQNPNLATFYCTNNSIFNLDLSQNSNLVTFNCNGNQLRHLNIKNGNNANVTTFSATGNALTCIEVDDAGLSATNWTNIDGGVSFSSNCGLSPVGPFVNIPDPNFKAYLLINALINTNGDTEIQVSEAAAFSGLIEASNLGINNLVGIEAFVNLHTLDCSFNAISSLDVTQNVDLESLNYSGTELTNVDLSQNLALKNLYCSEITGLLTIDVSQNINLEELSCYDNTLTSLDLTQNLSLETLHCYNSQISSLNVSQNTNLVTLDCSNNQLSSLNVSQSVNLVTLIGNQNQLSSLNVSQNTVLETLSFASNQLTVINLSSNTALTAFDCNSNNLTALDLTPNINLVEVDCKNNSLTSLDLRNGNNLTISSFASSGNPALSCIDVNIVNHFINSFSDIDSTSSYSTNCGATAPIVTIPDVNFKAYLVGSTAINTNGDTEIQVTEATAFNGTIDCSSLSIGDLTGVEAFVNVRTLDCSSNSLTTLDVTQNSNLTSLTCHTNSLTTLDVSQNTSLTSLDCHTNNLTSLDVSQNTSLTTLTCHTNNLTSLNVSQNTSLTTLACHTNSLTTLNVSQNTSLTSLDCYTNNLTSLDVSQNTSLTTLDCHTNNLTSLDVSQNVHLTALDCSSNTLNSLDVRNNNHNNVTIFNALNNSNLSCIEVNNITYSTANWTNVDAGASFSVNCSAVAPIVTIPNANFKTYLVGNTAINTDGDTEIQVTEAEAFTGTMNCSNLSITDLTGVEAFVNLTELYCSGNDLNSLDLSQNTNLIILACQNNGTTSFSLNITQCTNLEYLDCSNSNMGSLNVSQNTNLIELYCASNAISTLDVSQNTNLVKVYCESNTISSLDVNQSTDLTHLGCFSNTLSNLDVTSNTSLIYLDCNNNLITSLDLTQNTSLETLDCSFNQLSSLDLVQNASLTELVCTSNQLTRLDVRNGSNTNVTLFDATSNSNLSCIDVDNAAYATTNWTNIDLGASFSPNCNPLNVFIPDINFKAYLVGNAAINTSGDTEIQFTEAAAFTGTINCPNRSIASLKGIEAFVNLRQLKCYNNKITSLDVSQNANLVVLHCVNNSITSLDVTQNTSLSWLYCSTNEISALDLTQNTNLTKLYCNDNQIASLDVSQNVNLVVLDCSSNALSSLDVKNGQNARISIFKATSNPDLTCIQVDDAAYSNSNWTQIDATASFNNICVAAAPIVHIPDANFKAYLVGNSTINRDGDAEIQVSEALLFTGTINCPNLNITDLTGVEAFVNLTQLKCYRNNLTSLDVSQNTSLTVLHCVNNLITSLDVTQNTSLTQLYCSDNPITSLDVTQNTNLTKLYCNTTPLTTLDVTQNTSLIVLDCSSAQLSNLNVKNGNNANFTTFKATNNANLTCIEVDDVAYATTNWVNRDAIVFFSINCGAPTVNIPDANFKAYLVANTAINTNGDNDIQVTEAVDFAGTINCPNLSIADLTGVEAFVNLLQLKCYNNNLASLDVRQNTNLVVLHCVNNSITSLDVTSNTNLSWLYCSSNQLSSLDLSQNTSLTKLYCGANQLSSLNVKSGNNAIITTFNTTNNANLTCIEVDDVAYSTTNWTAIDAGAAFSTNCAVARVVHIPDANFKASLLENRAINTNMDKEIQVSEASAFTGQMDCPNSTITDVTGIEAFVNSLRFNCEFNTLNNLDLTHTMHQQINLTIYPNPTRKDINIDFGKTYEEVTIQITNVTGHIIKRKTMQHSATVSLELEGGAGVYFVRIQTEEGRAILKVIKE